MKLPQRLTTARIASACMVTLASQARADVVTDWNTTADALVVQSRIGTPPAVRAMAIAQTAVHEAVMAAGLVQPGDGADVAAQAAVAAANRSTLARLLPQHTHEALETAYKAALAKLVRSARQERFKLRLCGAAHARTRRVRSPSTYASPDSMHALS